MPRKAKSKRTPNAACGELIVAWKSKPSPTPEEVAAWNAFIDAVVALEEEPRPPESAPLRLPGHRDWPEPNGCVRGPEEDDAAFERRLSVNAESYARLLLRNQHNARTVKERTDAELACQRYETLTGNSLQGVQAAMYREEDEARRAEDKRNEVAVKAEGRRLQCAKNKPPRKRRRKAPPRTRKVTGLQTEALHQLGLCDNNVTKAAEAMGITRKTFRDHVEAAYRNLGRRAAKLEVKTSRLPTDQRGQGTVADNDQGPLPTKGHRPIRTDRRER